MFRFLLLASLAVCLATAPRLAAAQDGGFPVQTTANTRFLMQNGEVVRYENGQTTPLTQNVKLSTGVKINYKNGIVEMPADKINPKGKKITLREGDYVRADGGVVFATPGSAAAAQGKAAAGTPGANSARYDTYVQRGPGFSDPSIQMGLLQKKVELLTQKVQVLSQGRTDMPDTKSIDDQMAQINSQLNSPK
ncbi:DUF6799 domain-containing protein [Hymenobacter monticola]|uniref:DUF6799 domain-containing protein n=1 Tax=Hymenobacter monticola TaxID=1705399 RepID=A0ABY4B053_9BACT|nr:DUF6799 domain-containing protein [Hymenobacter monticola]UOE32517.1 hypothetical protein MTP16_15430 [Hymenobacter monticola]